jgi:hypothetical protein
VDRENGAGNIGWDGVGCAVFCYIDTEESAALSLSTQKPKCTLAADPQVKAEGTQPRLLSPAGCGKEFPNHGALNAGKQPKLSTLTPCSARFEAPA